MMPLIEPRRIKPIAGQQRFDFTMKLDPQTRLPFEPPPGEDQTGDHDTAEPTRLPVPSGYRATA